MVATCGPNDHLEWWWNEFSQLETWVGEGGGSYKILLLMFTEILSRPWDLRMTKSFFRPYSLLELTYTWSGPWPWQQLHMYLMEFPCNVNVQILFQMLLKVHYQKNYRTLQVYTCWLELILILYKAHWTPIMSNKNYFISSYSQN